MDISIARILEGCFSHPDQGAEERRKTVIFASCLLVLTPAIYLFSGINLWLGRVTETWLPLILATSMLLLLATMKLQKSVVDAFRVITILSLATLGYELYIGGGEGHAFVWYYCFPVIVFYIYGRKEGLFWVITSIVLTATIFLLPSTSELYGLTHTIRFLLTYSIVAAISYSLEASREQYFRELIREKNNLETAMQQIKTLRGLLPICASCKSIRDDQGYWNQIETYLFDHSEARFSHGICPDCLKSLYPGEYAEMARNGSLGRNGTINKK